MDKGKGGVRKGYNKKKFKKYAKKGGKKSMLYTEANSGNDQATGRIDEETFQYFLHVLKIMDKPFESEEDKVSFVENVFEQISGNELNYSCNQVLSRILDNLLPLASDETLVKFSEALDADLRFVCRNSYASFVLQRLLVTTRDKENQKLRHWFEKVCKFVLNNGESFLYDNFANHIVRTALACLCGDPKLTENNWDLVADEKSISNEYVVLIQNFADLIISLNNLPELSSQSKTSGLLQVLMRCLTVIKSKKAKKLGRKLLDECFAPESQVHDDNKADVKMEINAVVVPSIFSNEPRTRLLETVLSVAAPKLYTQIYARCFINKLGILAKDSAANHAVQKLISSCQEKTEFESIFEELSSVLEELKCKNTGVILRLCEGCLRFKTKQKIFVSRWAACVCDGKMESLATSIMYLPSKFGPDGTPVKCVNLNGSLILQNMLKFNKPIHLVKSILSTDREELTAILCDPRGSHLNDAFFQSDFIGEKSKESLARALQGSFITLATSKHGSRVFDVIWNWARCKLKASIASELLMEESRLRASPFGAAIAFNIALGSFRHDRETWLKAQNDAAKVKKLFADFPTEEV